eukprot:gene206-4452_t
MSGNIHELCKDFNTKRGCKKGKKCQYIHHKVKKGEKVSIEFKTDQPKDWEKIENTPKTLNNYLNLLGYDTKECEFFDVFGLDEDCLKMLPKEVFGVVCCMPVCKNIDFKENKENEFLNPKEEEEKEMIQDDLYFIEQTIGNSCAGISLIHILSNNLNELKLKVSSPLDEFLKKTKNLKRKEISKELEYSKELSKCHLLASNPNAKIKKNSTKRVNYLIIKTENDEPTVFYHFISFIIKNDILYEMDSRRSKPIKRMKTSKEKFVFDVAEILKLYMSISNQPYLFNMVAFGKNEIKE